MDQKEYIIDKSAIDKAQNSNDVEWLKNVHQRAVQTIKDGGLVKIAQQYSDASSEIITVIDQIKQMDHFMERYF
jgi:hypothetical protein